MVPSLLVIYHRIASSLFIYHSLFALVIGLCGMSRAYGQSSFNNVISLGQAGSGSATLSGLGVLDLNPARLSAKDAFRKRLTFFMPSVLTDINSNSFSISLYNQLFGRSTRGLLLDENEWSEADKSLLMSRINSGGASAGGNGRISLGFAYDISDDIGTIALMLHQNGGGFLKANRDIFEFGLYGNEQFLGRSVDFSETQGFLWWNRDYALSYSRFFNLDAKGASVLYTGITVKIVQALGHFEAESNSRLFNSSTGDSLAARIDYTSTSAGAQGMNAFFDQIFGIENTNAGFPIFPGTIGSGFGIDLGAAISFENGMRFSLALMDLGHISITDQLITRSADTLLSFTGIQNPLNGTLRQNQFDSLRAIAEYQVRELGSSSFGLPTRIRAGAGLDLQTLFKFPMVLSLDFSLGFNDNYGNLNHILAMFGSEYRPIEQISLRSGISLGGGAGLRWAFGTGYENGVIGVDISTHNFPAFLDLTGSQSVSVAVGFRLKFIDNVASPMIDDFVPIELDPVSEPERAPVVPKKESPLTPQVEPKPVVPQTPNVVAPPAPPVEQAPVSEPTPVNEVPSTQSKVPDAKTKTAPSKTTSSTKPSSAPASTSSQKKPVSQKQKKKTSTPPAKTP